MKQTPPIVLPDGTTYNPAAQGTQYIQDDGTTYRTPQLTDAFRYQSDRSLDDDYQAPPRSGAVVADAVAANQTPFERLVNGQAGTRTPATDAAAAAAATAPTLGSRVAALFGKGKQLAAGVGQRLANDPLGALNAGLGVAGAIEYATARAPKLPGTPDTYSPLIRPAQGLNATALAGGRAQIQAAQRQASRPVSSDAGTNTVQRLFAQAQAGQQQNELTNRDNEAFQQDQRRVDEQQNQAYQANYTTQRSYKEKVFDLGQRAFEARRQQGAAMSQAALTYFTQARADKLNSVERGKESALYAQLGIAPAGSRPRPAAGQYPPAEQQSLAKGGKFKFSLSAGRRSADKFGDRQSRLTEQAQRAFQQSLREASAKRGKGLK